LQARVLHRDRHYWIENLSAASPMLHNGRRLIAGMRVILREGDELRIGPYTLLASLGEDVPGATSPPESFAGQPREDRTAILPPEDRAAIPPPVERTAILTRWDRTAILPQEEGTAVLSRQDRTAILPREEGTAILNRGDRTAILPREEGTAVLSRQDRTAILARQDRTAILPRDERTEEPGLQSAPGVSNVRSAPTGTPHNPGAELLWGGFLEGAGLELSLPNGPSPTLLREIGEMLKIAVAGIQSLLMVRAKAKSEMRAHMTKIQVRDNNPLKFSPDAALALEWMLQPSKRGFLTGPAALRDALSDLQSHQAGMTAGMRTAAETVLERLDPATIEAMPLRLSLLDRLIPARRKARLWELYAKQHQALRAEARNSFQRSFAEPLREAYEAEVSSFDTSLDPTGVTARASGTSDVHQ
jgi:type VI secretion system FHA domain protein